MSSVDILVRLLFNKQFKFDNSAIGDEKFLEEVDLEEVTIDINKLKLKKITTLGY